MKKKLIILTEKEYNSLNLLIGNGWGDGDFAGYGGENPSTQVRAMKKFQEAIEVEKGQIIKI